MSHGDRCETGRSYNLRLSREHGTGISSAYLRAKYGDFEINSSPKKSPSKKRAVLSSVHADDVHQLVPEPLNVTISASSGSLNVELVPAVSNLTLPSVSTVPVLTQCRSSVPTAQDSVVSSLSVPLKVDTSFRELQKASLLRLNNLLKLPQARRWVLCEFFYAEVDRELFLGENEFSGCLRELLPTLKTRQLNRCQWRAIRHLIGKPRRFSASFLEEERNAIQLKRQLVRELYYGSVTSLDKAEVDLPSKVAHPLTVGDTVFAALPRPNEGVFRGVVHAVADSAYRVVFDKVEMPPMIVPDTAVMREASVETVTVGFFIKRNRAAQAGQFFKTPGFNPPVATVEEKAFPDEPLALRTNLPSCSMSGQFVSNSPVLQNDPLLNRLPFAYDDEFGKTLGNFPSSLLFAVVRLNNLIKEKRINVHQLHEMNSHAERLSLMCDNFPDSFQSRYAEIVLKLEELNRLLDEQLSIIGKHMKDITVQTADVTINHPEKFHKLSLPYATSIVMHCNTTNNVSVKSQRIIDLIVSFTSLLLHVKSVAAKKESGGRGITSADIQALRATVAEVKQGLHPRNASVFEQKVEYHFHHIEKSLLSGLQSWNH